MLVWILWGLLLVAQNASFTMVSRARNSGSLVYHALAALLSNGIWFASQFILFAQMLNILLAGTWAQAVLVGLYYTVCTLVGSVGMHYLALNRIEKGARRVGAHKGN